MSYVENQKTISDWATKTFGYSKSLQIIIDRMLKEVRELENIGCEQDQKSMDEIAGECADIYIMLVQIVDMIGYDLHACVDHKMQINRARKWKSFGDGTGQHIEE